MNDFAPFFPPAKGQQRSLVPLQTGGSQRPLFCIPGLGGHVAAFMPLAHGLAAERPVYGFQAQGLDPGQQPQESFQSMAELYLMEMRMVQPQGPYLLLGWSLGGLIALEVARRLAEAGEEVPLLAMLDSFLSIADHDASRIDQQSVLRWIVPHLKLSLGALTRLTLQQQWQRIAEQAQRSDGIGVPEIRRLAEVCKAQLAAASRYLPQPYQSSAVLFRAAEGNARLDARWKDLCPRLRVETVPGNHYSMLRKPHVDVLVERLSCYLRESADGRRMV